VGPNDEGKETENDDRPNHGLVSPKRLAGVAGYNLGNTSDGRKKKNVDLRVTQEPEKVLEKKRTSGTGKIHGRSA
jgi:hypothetical protein